MMSGSISAESTASAERENSRRLQTLLDNALVEVGQLQGSVVAERKAAAKADKACKEKGKALSDMAELQSANKALKNEIGRLKEHVTVLEKQHRSQLTKLRKKADAAKTAATAAAQSTRSSTATNHNTTATSNGRASRHAEAQPEEGHPTIDASTMSTEMLDELNRLRADNESLRAQKLRSDTAAETAMADLEERTKERDHARVSAMKAEKEVGVLQLTNRKPRRALARASSRGWGEPT